jgi:hypothetical protein
MKRFRSTEVKTATGVEVAARLWVFGMSTQLSNLNQALDCVNSRQPRKGAVMDSRDRFFHALFRGDPNRFRKVPGVP